MYVRIFFVRQILYIDRRGETDDDLEWITHILYYKFSSCQT